MDWGGERKGLTGGTHHLVNYIDIGVIDEKTVLSQLVKPPPGLILYVEQLWLFR